MAARKNSAVTARKARAKALPAEPSTPRQAAQSSDNNLRLLREAAWSRMFGRVEAKNPFTR
jgi:hypothetical protein